MHLWKWVEIELNQMPLLIITYQNKSLSNMQESKLQFGAISTEIIKCFLEKDDDDNMELLYLGQDWRQLVGYCCHVLRIYIQD